MKERITINNITVDVDTNKMVKKLRAIAKHAEALANELEEIDQAVCKKCGSSKVNVSKVRCEEPFKHFHCGWCGNTWTD